MRTNVGNTGNLVLPMAAGLLPKESKAPQERRSEGRSRQQIRSARHARPRQNRIDHVFPAAAEAIQEAMLNSMLSADCFVGRGDKTRVSLADIPRGEQMVPLHSIHFPTRVEFARSIEKGSHVMSQASGPKPVAGILDIGHSSVRE
ncbi:hypothetical protein [Microvirga makkahensis]|uniref:hypothetical protein n=1 Tax=Microvirga makkahensis TaxID=1128670 RepID=UPI0031B5B59E